MEKQPYPTASHSENSDSSILPSLSWWDSNLASKCFKSTAFWKRDTIPLGLLESSSVGLAAYHGGKLQKYINRSAFSGMSQGPQEQFPRQSWQGASAGRSRDGAHRHRSSTAPWLQRPGPHRAHSVQWHAKKPKLPWPAMPHHSHLIASIVFSRYRVFNLAEQNVSFSHSPFLTRSFFLLLIKC